MAGQSGGFPNEGTPQVASPDAGISEQARVKKMQRARSPTEANVRRYTKCTPWSDAARWVVDKRAGATSDR